MDVQQEPRISQLLPAIKYSDCDETVEFRRLGEHICQAAPAVPALPSAFRKPAINPSSGTGIFFAKKLCKIYINRALTLIC